MEDNTTTTTTVEVTLSSSSTVEKDEWGDKVNNHSVSRSDLNTVIMDYLVREGFREAALSFEKETGIQSGLDDSLMESQIQIRSAIETGEVQKAVETLNDLDLVILDTSPELFFHLQLQQLLEFIRQGNIDEALTYAQSELSARGEENPKFLEELESALALLAYDDPAKSPFSSLLQHSQRLKIVSELNSAILSNQGKDEVSRLSVLMKLVLWAQTHLEKKGANFPKLTNICSSTLTHPQ